MLSEQQIILGCQNGQKTCQYALVKRYSGMLMTVCRRYAQDETTAKDLLQDTLIRIFKYIHNYQPIGSFEAWMRKIAIRCSLDWIGQQRFNMESLIDENGEMEGFQPEIFSQLHSEEIIKLVQSLTPSLRMVFNLNVIEGYSHKEIAEMLNITESTSRTNLVRARQLLQGLMAENYLIKNRTA